MASALGSAVLDVLLGDYIEGLDQRQLELDVLNGHLLLQNLSVRETAFRQLQLPFAIKAGIIGRVELRIPWANLSSQPTQLRLKDILLLVVPQSESMWNEEAERKREDHRKRSLLDAYEKKSVVASSSAECEQPSHQRSTFAARLSARILDRLQVDVTDLVIRYVDASHARRPYTITLGIRTISLRSSERGTQCESQSNATASKEDDVQTTANPKSEATSDTMRKVRTTQPS